MIDKTKSVAERIEAFDLVDKFRAAHSYPINTFQSTLHERLRSFPGSFLAQRLKRMPAIMLKLRREKTMQITTMQDIGGLRAVVNSIEDMYKLATMYTTPRKFEHIQKAAIDYISAPRKSGYRSLHLIYEYRNKLEPQYDGLLIELQIRTKIQHSWATAVEIMETITKQPLKSSLGEREWLNFFALTASAFAFLENTSTVPGYSHLTRKETFTLVKREEERLKIRTLLETLPPVIDDIVKQPQASKYHLIIQEFDEKPIKITVRSYSRESLRQAIKDYNLFEAQTRKKEGSRSNVVLVSAHDLKKAYPNLFLKSQDFIENLNKIIQEV